MRIMSLLFPLEQHRGGAAWVVIHSHNPAGHSVYCTLLSVLLYPAGATILKVSSLIWFMDVEITPITLCLQVIGIDPHQREYCRGSKHLYLTVTIAIKDPKKNPQHHPEGRRGGLRIMSLLFPLEQCYGGAAWVVMHPHNPAGHSVDCSLLSVLFVCSASCSILLTLR